ncbi:hypothetical protein [uncultured Jannaschia sp.]|uniref:hypothetical protein n=1 Tax=uncultured Jannaschia sp. TaxID=293347 RepID=UPI0026344B6A|nr:hypothetical protein [uncultured Jannaschia sp.]
MSDVDRGLVLRLSADIKKLETAMKKAQAITASASKDMERRTAATHQKMARTAEESGQAIGQEMDRLRAKYDPVFAASKRYEAALEDLNRAQKIGAIDAATHAQALDRLNAEYAEAAGPIRATGAALQQTSGAMVQANTASQAAGGGMLRFFNVSSAGRFVLQNTASQLGDIAVQLEGGTDKSRVAAQQLPQLLGGFGALGGVLGLVAPLLGTVAAVGIPLGAMFLAVGGDSAEAAEEVQTFAEKLNAAEAALGRAEAAMELASAGGLEDLQARYGEVTRSVVELADALADIEKRAATFEIGQVLGDATISNFAKTFADALGGVAAVAIEADTEQLDAAVEQVRELATEITNLRALNQPVPPALTENFERAREELAVLRGEFEAAGTMADELAPNVETIERVRDLARAYDEALAEGRFRDVADALASMRDLIAQTGVEVEQGLLDKMVQAEDAARQTAARLSDAETNASGVADAASGVPGLVNDAANAADRLASNLGAAMAALRGVMAGMQSANRVAANRIAAERATVGKPVERAGALARVDANEDSGAAAYAAIRGGKPNAVREVADFVDGAAQGARDIAAAQAELDAAEKAFRDAAKPAGGSGSSGGSGGSAKDEPSIFEAADQEIAAIRDRIATLDMSAAASARYETQQRLLNAAREAGISLDARDAQTGQTVRETIEAKADAVGRLTEEFERGQLGLDSYRRGLDTIAEGIGQVIVDGQSMGEVFGNVLKQMAADLANSGIRRGLEALVPSSGGGFLSSLLGAVMGGAGGGGAAAAANAASGSGGLYADGAAFRSGRVVPFAKGGAFTNSVVSRPTVAPQALFGEAGPEAIMPLTRGPGGKLGVHASGGGKVAVDVRLGIPEGVTVETVRREVGNAIVTVGPGMVMKTLRGTGNRGASRKVV